MTKQASGGWGLAYVGPGLDLMVRDALISVGIEAYVPMIAGARRAGAARPPEPMFPRYVFVRHAMGDAGWFLVYSTRGVAKVLQAGSRPALVADAVVQAIRAREVYGLVLMEEEPFAPLEPVIYRGETADVPAIFLERVDKDRVSILIALLGDKARPSKNVVPSWTLLRSRAEACPKFSHDIARASR